MRKRNYEKRPKDVYRFRICECGHTWGSHGFRWWMLRSDGKCEDCMCPQYREIGRLTSEEKAIFEAGGEI